MIQMRMREKDVEFICAQMLADPIEPGPCVKHDSHLGQHQASSLPSVAGMISARAK
jgi:hypothetical protein